MTNEAIRTTDGKKAPKHHPRITPVGLVIFVMLLLCLGLALTLVWFLSLGKYLSAILCLVAALGLSRSTTKLLMLDLAERKP